MAFIAIAKNTLRSSQPGPAALRWVVTPQRSFCRLSQVGCEMLLALAHEQGIPEPIGVIIAKGVDEDAGTFAIQPAHYVGHTDRRVFALHQVSDPTKSPARRQTYFSCAEIGTWQARGWSVLTPRDGMLVATLGTLDNPGQRRRRKAHGKG